ncbi:MAG: phage major capsid protein [Vallitalea sp.]|jgi:HK97 family phage major capsid protein|nr:phage major capsid protein [Vallitalea sp.]
MKGLIEKRNELIEEVENMVNVAETEVRSFTEDEITQLESKKAEISNLNKTIEMKDEVRGMEKTEVKKVDEVIEETRSQEEIDNEELRSVFEQRTAMNTKVSKEGGVVINEVLSSEIIKEIKDRSNVYSFFDGTNIKGSLKIPKKTGKGKANWVAEGTTPDSNSTATIPSLEVLALGQNRLYTESAITQSMINVQELDLKSFVLNDIAENMGDEIENSIFNGTGSDQPTGLISGIKTSNKITLATRGEVDINDFKKAKGKLKKEALKGAKWFMHADSLLLVDLLKDADGRPLLQPDVTQKSDYTILGLPVELTDAMATPTTTGAKCLVVLASPNAYHTNTQKTISINIYDDSSYKRAGLIGYESDVYMDGKVKDDQRLAGIFNKSA